MRKIILSMMVMIAVTPVAFAGEGHSYKPYVGSEAFEKLKTLAGNWEGLVIEPGQTEEKPAKVSYEVSSGGSALVEKLGPGSESEMVSVYNDENGSLVMTHYCLMHNQPKLKLKSSDDQNVELEMFEANGVKMTDAHMHSLKVHFDGKDEITQEWMGYSEGKPSEKPVVIKLKRVA